MVCNNEFIFLLLIVFVDSWMVEWVVYFGILFGEGKILFVYVIL